MQTKYFGFSFATKEKTDTHQSTFNTINCSLVVTTLCCLLRNQFLNGEIVGKEDMRENSPSDGSSSEGWDMIGGRLLRRWCLHYSISVLRNWIFLIKLPVTISNLEGSLVVGRLLCVPGAWGLKPPRGELKDVTRWARVEPASSFSAVAEFLSRNVYLIGSELLLRYDK